MLRQHALQTLVILFTCITLTICTSESVTAQKKETEAAKSTPKETKTAVKKQKVRLPNHYGKLNLTESQRTKIYKIQTDYKSQIDSLKKQLAELNEKRNAECEMVLNTSQKSILDEILAQIEKKRAARKKK